MRLRLKNELSYGSSYEVASPARTRSCRGARENLKVVAKFLRSKQAALVDAVFGSLLKIANEIVGQIMASPLAFHESDVRPVGGHPGLTTRLSAGPNRRLLLSR